MNDLHFLLMYGQRLKRQFLTSLVSTLFLKNNKLVIIITTMMMIIVIAMIIITTKFFTEKITSAENWQGQKFHWIPLKIAQFLQNCNCELQVNSLFRPSMNKSVSYFSLKKCDSWGKKLLMKTTLQILFKFQWFLMPFLNLF